MSVDRDTVSAKDLRSSYRGVDYFFCGKGCKLEFVDDPEHSVDSSHVPSM